MKNSISRSVFVALIAGCTAASSMAVSAPLERPNSFDGNWSVTIRTRQGDCSESLRYRVRIVGGRVQSLEQNYRAAGAVSSNGTIRVVVAEADRSASGAGRLKGNVGSGLWRTDRGDCSGDWTAERRMDNW
jgi:hypothetical protein